MDNLYYVYILASKKNGTIYIGVTNNLLARVYQHREGLISGFTADYQVHHLVYFETTTNIVSAISREKQIKKWNRAWKIRLIEKNNPDWIDLYSKLNGSPTRLPARQVKDFGDDSLRDTNSPVYSHLIL